SYGLLIENYPLEEIDHVLKKIESVKSDSIIEPLRCDLELLMTEAYFRLATHLNAGMLNRDSLWHEFKIKDIDVDMPAYLLGAINNKSVISSLVKMQPQFRAYKKLQKHMAIFIKENNDINTEELRFLSESADDEERLNFSRNYLLTEHYLDSVSVTDDSLFAEALKIFQRRHGLIEDGALGKNTLYAMQISKREKYETIMVNLERFRWTNSLPDNYIIVNKAAYRLRAIENDSIVLTHRVVVGSKTNITPEISSQIEYMVANPVWFVPYSISTKEILPKVKEDVSYLERNNYGVYSKSGEAIPASDVKWDELSTENFGYKIRQKPGRSNSLGTIKFIFPNKHSIYLHDTPSKSFFSRDLRTFSHGCVRVENPKDLAKYLLEFDQNEVTPDSLDILFDKKITKKIFLNNAHPIFLKYYTSEVNEFNEIVFYKDVYGRDLQISNAIFRLPVDIRDQIASRGI
ncbi:MAG: L,D-transpeptidase family protein, partial [Bacteroidia bacterium]|nr:L,D-transpeptidase family protein [Bacteroidia bacterium]